MDETKEVRQIPIEDIIPNRFQPRISFDEKALNELASSIKQHGIIQPLVVRPLGDKFEIIAGERRYKAATIAGLTVVPAIVTEMDDNTSAEVALIENVQRKDLTAIEEAKSYKNMLDRNNLTQEELAKKMGLSQSTIANKLRLLNLCDEVQNALLNEKISERHARALLSVNGENEQVKWLNRIINERLTVRQLDLAIKDEQNERSQTQQGEGDIPIVDINPDIDSIISNTTDINTPETKQNVNVFEGLVNNNEQNDSFIENKEGIVDTKPGNGEIPNKFFNFLEDEAANMNVVEDTLQNQTSTNNGVEIFNFTPEFENIEQTSQGESEIVSNNNENEQINPIDVQSDTAEIENIEVLDVLDTSSVQETDVTNTEDNKLDDEKVDSTSNEYISVSDAIDNQIDTTNDNKDDNNIVIEPIPIVEGNNILDPVKLFDTLEPGFYDKVKESIGADLKTAINKYRDLSTDLTNRGFNINIEEIDEDKKYVIQIEIGKE